MEKTIVRIFFCGVAACWTFFGSGCASDVVRKIEVCRGWDGVSAAVGELREFSGGIDQFRVSSGSCEWVEKVGGKVEEKQSFAVKFWVSSPCSIRMQGDIAFNPKGLLVGSNSKQFWLALRPNEISGYWWGDWSEQGSGGRLTLSPEVLLEAFGLVDFSDYQNWSLRHEGAFDVLVHGSGGVVRKKIYVYNCDKKVSKIEYFDSSGEIYVVVELEKYIEIYDGVLVASYITITSRVDEGVEDVFAIRIKSAQRTDYGDAQQEKLFARPPERGYKKIYRIIEGRMIEQGH